MLVTKNSQKQLSANFKEAEFHSKSIDAPDSHYVNDKLIDMVQIIRDYFDVPVRITSTLRTKLGNQIAGGVSDSLHLTGNAIDWQFAGEKAEAAHLRYREEIKAKAGIYNSLRKMGINGIGLYDNFNHIQVNEKPSGNPLYVKDKYGLVNVWDKKKS